jgi:GTPase SAR1 family protein
MGEGGAGKTCLARALLCKPFGDTQSTEALDTLTVGISSGSSVTSGGWHEMHQQAVVLEEAVISIAQDISVKGASSRGEVGMLTWLRSAMLGPAPQERQLAVLNDVSIDVTSLLRKAARREVNKLSIEVSLYDFGGQDVFNCLHPFFLTRFGINCVVFNMTWFAADRSSLKTLEALSYLSYWLNSVVLNTRHQGSIAPILLVGTHKDIVSDRADHLRISVLLSDTFCRSTAWPAIVMNDRDEILFFPVNNTQGADDAVVRELSVVVEATLTKDKQMQVERPLSWYHALDNLVSIEKKGQPTITLEHACRILVDSGVGINDVPTVLAFFRDMGMLMWYEDEALRDVVILDPVAFLVKPVARVICDPELHCLEAHSYCARHHHDAYPAMKYNGIVSQSLLRALLGYGGNEGNCDMLITLMLKYGLLVTWELQGTTEVTYLVPALFPLDVTISKSVGQVEEQAWAQGKLVSTVFIVFSLHKTLHGSCVPVDQLAAKCFLPSGLFDRLISTVLEWSQQGRDIDPATFKLCKNVIIMQIANVRFRLVWRSASNSLELNTVSASPITVMRRIEGMLTRLLDDNIQSLYLRSFVLSTVLGAVETNRTCDGCLVPVKDCMRPAASMVFPSFGDGKEIAFDYDAVIRQHPWLFYRRPSGRFDVFLSHRWGDYDNKFVSALFDRLADYVVDNAPVSVFYDVNHMKVGHQFNQQFFMGLLGSVTVVPVVSRNALQRMLNSKAGTVDNVLVEWIIVLTLINYPAVCQVPLRAVVPLCFLDSAGDYFSINEQLPATVPTASCEEVLNLFRLARIDLPTEVVAFINAITVKKVVEGIMKAMCVKVDITKPLKRIVSECTTEVMNIVLRKS